jgi:hypothetical protein
MLEVLLCQLATYIIDKVESRRNSSTYRKKFSPGTNKMCLIAQRMTRAVLPLSRRLHRESAPRDKSMG